MRRSALGALVTACLLAGSPAAAAPANDDRTHAILLTFPLEVTVDTSGATVEQGERGWCDVPLAATVWYRFEVSDRSWVAIDTVGSAFDTVLAVWEIAEGGAGWMRACNDDVAPDDLTSKVADDYEPGSYLVQLGGYGSAQGIARLRGTARPLGPPPSNDTRDGATDVTLPYSEMIDLSAATSDPSVGCSSGARGVWYRIAVDETMAVRATIRYPGHSSYASLDLYRPGATFPECRDGANGIAVSTWRADAGATYVLFVDAALWNQDPAEIALTIEQAPAVDLSVASLAVSSAAGPDGVLRRTVEVTLESLTGAPADAWLRIEACPVTFGWCAAIATTDVRVGPAAVTRTFTWQADGAGDFDVTATVEAFDITELHPGNDGRSVRASLVADGGGSGVGVGCVNWVFACP